MDKENNDTEENIDYVEKYMWLVRLNQVVLNHFTAVFFYILVPIPKKL